MRKATHAQNGKDIFLYVIAVLFVLTPVLWFASGYLIIGHDSGFRIDYLSHFRSQFFAWNAAINFGTDWSITKGFLAIQFPETVFSHVFGSFRIGQMLTFIAWNAVMFISSYITLRSIFPDTRYRFFHIFTSLFYICNFYILQGWFIAERAKFSLFAALPLATLMVYRVLVLDKPIARNALYFGLIFIFLNGGGSPPLYGAILVALTTAFVYFGYSRVKRGFLKKLFHCIKTALAFGVAFVVFNAYWVVPLYGLTKTSYGSSLGALGGIDGLIGWERVISRNASLLNLIRLQGGPDWYGPEIGHAFSGPYISNPLLIAASYIPVLLIICALSMGMMRQIPMHIRRYVSYLFVLLPIGLFFSGGTHPPLGWLYEQLMRYVPGFAVFRSSYYKFGPTVWYPMIVLSGLSLDFLINKFVRPRTIFTYLGCLCLIGLIGYHYPYYSTKLFDITNGFSTRLQIPNYIYDAGTKLNSLTGSNARILVLPELNEGYYGTRMDTYRWGYFSMDMLPRIISGRTFLMNDSYSTQHIAALYDSIYDGNVPLFKKLASSYGVTHILWRDDYKFNDEASAIRLASKAKNTLQRLGLVDVFRSGPWELYRLTPSSGNTARILTADTYISARYVENFNGLRSLDPIDSNDLVLTSEWHFLNVPSSGVVVQASCVACGRDTFEKQRSRLSFADLKYPPGTLLYRIAAWRQRKRLVIQPGMTPQQQIDVHLATMGDSLAHIRFFSRVGGNNDIEINNNIDRYVDSSKGLFAALDKLSGVSGNDYLVRIKLFTSLHRGSIPQNLSSDALLKLNNAIRSVSDAIDSSIWLTDTNAWRYLLHVTSPGLYRLNIVDSDSDICMIDSHMVVSGNSIDLTEGLHKVELKDDGTVHNRNPSIFFTSIDQKTLRTTTPQVRFINPDPTLYAIQISQVKDDYLLRLDQQYSPGWKAISVRFSVFDVFGRNLRIPFGVSSIREHFEVDGYANGWFVGTGHSRFIVLYYQPQLYVYAGLSITVIALITILFLNRRFR